MYSGSVNRKAYAEVCNSSDGRPWCQLMSGVYGGIASRTSEKEMRKTMRKGIRNSTNSHSVGMPATRRCPDARERRATRLLGQHHGTGAMPEKPDGLVAGDRSLAAAHHVGQRHAHHRAGGEPHQVD